MRPWVVFAFWAVLLGVWTALQLLFSPPLLTLALLGGAAVGVALLALIARRERPARPAPDLSPATVVLALGAGVLVSGAELGTWCILLGALLTACGIGALIAEERR
jgi:asparagine N-glycosylation enzyme membrane subunit Stt3